MVKSRWLSSLYPIQPTLHPLAEICSVTVHAPLWSKYGSRAQRSIPKANRERICCTGTIASRFSFDGERHVGQVCSKKKRNKKQGIKENLSYAGLYIFLFHRTFDINFTNVHSSIAILAICYVVRLTVIRATSPTSQN
jgi:hypothetical protein